MGSGILPRQLHSMSGIWRSPQPSAQPHRVKHPATCTHRFAASWNVVWSIFRVNILFSTEVSWLELSMQPLLKLFYWHLIITNKQYLDWTALSSSDWWGLSLNRVLWLAVTVLTLDNNCQTLSPNNCHESFQGSQCDNNVPPSRCQTSPVCVNSSHCLLACLCCILWFVFYLNIQTPHSLLDVCCDRACCQSPCHVQVSGREEMGEKGELASLTFLQVMLKCPDLNQNWNSLHFKRFRISFMDLESMTFLLCPVFCVRC